jgi:hypothetical protein
MDPLHYNWSRSSWQHKRQLENKPLSETDELGRGFAASEGPAKSEGNLTNRFSYHARAVRYETGDIPAIRRAKLFA